MLDISVVKVSKNTDGRLYKLFCISSQKILKPKRSKPKEITVIGSYCPKRKVGQSWAYTKDTIRNNEETEEEE